MDVQAAHNNHQQQAPPQAAAEEQVVYVLFVNRTRRVVNLYWFRTGTGEREHIQFTLKPNQEVRMNTYNTHAWLFRDLSTGERMHVRHKSLFYPVRIRVPRNPERPDELCDVRSQVSIHLPLRTLRDICLWSITGRLKLCPSSTEQIINDFAIPFTLKQQLLSVNNSINIYRTQVMFAMMHQHRQ